MDLYHFTEDNVCGWNESEDFTKVEWWNCEPGVYVFKSDVQAAKTPRQPRVFNSKPENRSLQPNSVGEGCNQQSSGEGGSTQRNVAGKGSTQRNGGSGNKKVIAVPSDKVGCIIGKGGSKIRELERGSEAKITIGRSNGNTTDVTLSGLDEAISNAESRITDVLNYKPRVDYMKFMRDFSEVASKRYIHRI